MAVPQSDVRTAPAGTGLVRFGNGVPTPPPPPPPAPVTLTLSTSASAVAGTEFSVTSTATNVTGALVATPARVSGPSATFNPATVNHGLVELVKLFGVTAAAAGTLRIQETASAGIVSNAIDIVVSAAPNPPPPPPPASPPNNGTQTLSLSRSSSGSASFQFGLGWARGHVTDVLLTNLSSYRVNVLRRWSDGSVKHARVNGRATFSAGVPITVVATNGASPTGGAALTAADITAAAPSVSVQCGAIGTLMLSSLLASPVRTLFSSGEAVECHYWGEVGSTGLHAALNVRLSADGRLWVRVAVENGYLDNGAGAIYSGTNQTYDLTVLIGGATALAVTGHVHYQHASVLAEGWIGGDPAVVVGHDTTYLREKSGLVPRYHVFGAPSNATLNGLDGTYAPSHQGPHTASMGNAGYQPAIGLLPAWEAMYLTSGGDSRAYACTINGARSFRNYPVSWREKNTRHPVRPSVFPTWTINGPATGGSTAYAAGALAWEVAHHPSAGYFAYLLTADYEHYETMQLQASVCWAFSSSSQGSGTSRMLLNQERAVAWQLRTLGQLVGIAPTSDLTAGGFAQDASALLAYQYTTHQASITGKPANMTGKGFLNSYGYPYGAGGVAPWMTDFWVAANGHISELEPLSNMAPMLAVRDHMYKWVVGRLGVEGDATAHPFTRAATYSLQVSTAGSDATWRATWGDIYTAEYGVTNNSITNTLLGSPSQASYNYWGNMLPALAYAVDHDAPGAADAMERLRSAANWSDITGSGFADIPVWGILHRGYLAPSWVPAASTWRNIGTASATLVAARPPGWPNSEAAGPDANWSGAVYNPSIGARGAVVKHGSGHLNPGDALWAGVWVLDVDAGTVTGRNVPASPMLEAAPAQFSQSFNSFYESIVPGIEGHPYPPHTYDGLIVQSAFNGGGRSGKLHRIGIGGGASTCIHTFDLDSASAPPARIRDSVASLIGAHGGYPATAEDEELGGYWVMSANGQGGLSLIAWDGTLIATYSGVQFNENGNHSLIKIPAPWNCLLTFGTAVSGFYGSNSLKMRVCPLVAGVPQGWTAVTQSGDVPTDSRIGGNWSRILRKVIAMQGWTNGVTDPNVKTLTLPAPADILTGTYSWLNVPCTSADGSPIALLGPNPNGGFLPYANNGSWGRLVEAYHARCFIWWYGVNNQPQAIRLPGM